MLKRLYVFFSHHHVAAVMGDEKKRERKRKRKGMGMGKERENEHKGITTAETEEKRAKKNKLTSYRT